MVTTGGPDVPGEAPAEPQFAAGRALPAGGHERRSSEALVGRLLELLDVETLDTDLYRGARQPGGHGRVFGGQVVAQALAASMRSIDNGALVHSLHAYFMRPGDNEHPIIFHVHRDFDGRSFATRRVIALQGGRPILNMLASFQLPEGGLSHQATMPEAPAPETLLSARKAARQDSEQEGMGQRAERVSPRLRAIEVCPVEPHSMTHPAPRDPRLMTWIRAGAPLGDDPDVHRAILAFASDLGLLGASMLPHGVSFLSSGMQVASLDHAIWFHDEFRADEWLLYVMESPWSGGARGFNRGQVFSRDGRLVASVAQEGLIRMHGA